jgi:hypothetical protein
MKAQLQALVVGATLLAATGCPGPAGSGQDLATIISEVQSGTVKACSFLPVADSVAKLIPYVSTADAVVDLLCKALAQAQSTGTARAAAAALPGSNIAVPVNTTAGTVIVQGSLVQPGVPGTQRSSTNTGYTAASTPVPPACCVKGGGGPVEYAPGAIGLGNGERVGANRPAASGIGNGDGPVEMPRPLQP